MDVCSHRNIVSSHHQHLITPKKICSHHQFSRSHRHNFVHTMKMLITLLKILFTPSKFCSHHLFSESHRNNFVILFTPSQLCSHSGNFGSHHLNFVHTISIMFTLKNRVVHTQHIFNVCDQGIVLVFINNTTPITSHLVGRFFAMYCVVQCSCPPTEWL